MASKTNQSSKLMNVVAPKVSRSSPSKTSSPTTAGAFKQQAIVQPNEQSVPISFKTQKPPIWFKRLSKLQRRFGAATFVLIGGMLLVYGATVYAQQKWSQEYRKLENLQRHERQLINTNESLKNQMATEAEIPAYGLIPPNPATAVVLQPVNQNTSTPPRMKPATKIEIPLGY